MTTDKNLITAAITLLEANEPDEAKVNEAFAQACGWRKCSAYWECDSPYRWDWKIPDFCNDSQALAREITGWSDPGATTEFSATMPFYGRPMMLSILRAMEADDATRAK